MASIKVKSILDRARMNGWRLRITYNDGWSEAGYVDKSRGEQSVFILLPLRTSMGGRQIVVSDIARIEFSNKRDGGVLWQR